VEFKDNVIVEVVAADEFVVLSEVPVVVDVKDNVTVEVVAADEFVVLSEGKVVEVPVIVDVKDNVNGLDEVELVVDGFVFGLIVVGVLEREQTASYPCSSRLPQISGRSGIFDSLATI